MGSRSRPKSLIQSYPISRLLQAGSIAGSILRPTRRAENDFSKMN